MDRSNPDHSQIWRDRYDRACADYQADGRAGVLRASLHGLGYIGTRLNDEVTYQEGLRASAGAVQQVARQAVADPAGRGGFVSGLPAGWR